MTHTDTPTLAPTSIYTPDEVAAILSCSKTHVYRLMRTSALPYANISAPGSTERKARIRGTDLMKFIDDSMITD